MHRLLCTSVPQSTRVFAVYETKMIRPLDVPAGAPLAGVAWNASENLRQQQEDDRSGSAPPQNADDDGLARRYRDSRKSDKTQNSAGDHQRTKRGAQ